VTFFNEEDIYRAFGFRVTKKGKIKSIKRKRINGMRPHMVIFDEINLMEISLVDNPANPHCRVISVEKAK
jgi:phage head maturation protease